MALQMPALLVRWVAAASPEWAGGGDDGQRYLGNAAELCIFCAVINGIRFVHRFTHPKLEQIEPLATSFKNI